MAPKRVICAVLVLLVLALSSAACTWLTVPSPNDISQQSPETTPPNQSPAPTPAPEPPPTPLPSKELKLIAVGDIMLSANRAAGKQMAQKGYKYPFEAVKGILEKGDITFANMESPISTLGTKLPGKGITFRTDPMVLDGLKYAGIDILSLANNHILDYDDPALLDTLRLLDEADIQRIGAGQNLAEARKPAIIEKNGLKVAFLAYSDMADIYFSNKYKKVFAASDDRPGVAPTDIDMILEDVAAVRPQVDIVIVSLHWGVEDSNDTTDQQKEMAHRIIDAGADAILGHHPHVLQGVEIYRGKFIAYSLGNFVFDQLKENNKQSMILELDFKDDRWTAGKAYPVYMQEKGHPVIATGQQGTNILNKIAGLSKAMGTEVKVEQSDVAFDVTQQ